MNSNDKFHEINKRENKYVSNGLVCIFIPGILWIKKTIIGGYCPIEYGLQIRYENSTLDLTYQKEKVRDDLFLKIEQELQKNPEDKREIQLAYLWRPHWRYDLIDNVWFRMGMEKILHFCKDGKNWNPVPCEPTLNEEEEKERVKEFPNPPI